MRDAQRAAGCLEPGLPDDREEGQHPGRGGRRGVSVTTVSQVLNEVDGARIAEETRARVRQASEALGYVPSRLARGLRTQRTNTIGLLSDHIATTPHAGKIILGAQEAALGARLDAADLQHRR